MGLILVLVLGSLLFCGCAEQYSILRGKLDVSITDNSASSWIDPSKVLVGKVGNESIVIPVEIYNGQEVTTTFEIKLRIPDYLESGYESMSENSGLWVSVSDAIITIPPTSSKAIQVIVGKDGKDVSWNNTEVWISIKESTNKPYKIEFISRVLIPSNK